MKRTIITALSTLILTLSNAFSGEEIAVKPTLTLEGGRKAAEAAVAYAKANGAPGGAVAVVDDAGYLIYFVRLDGTFQGSPNISIGKAKTAVLFKKPTSDFETLVNKGRFAMTALPPDFTPLQGGVPISHGEHIIGAVGVSGAKSAQQDEEIAKAGVAAIEQIKTAAK